MYKPEKLAEADERKKKEKKRKGIATDEPQKKKRSLMKRGWSSLTLKRSDYSVVNQLKRFPTQISILALLLSSKGHR